MAALWGFAVTHLGSVDLVPDGSQAHALAANEFFGQTLTYSQACTTSLATVPTVSKAIAIHRAVSVNFVASLSRGMSLHIAAALGFVTSIIKGLTRRLQGTLTLDASMISTATYVPTLMIIGVVEEGYSVEFPSEVSATQLEGGPSRTRRDILDANRRVAASWVTDAAGYDYLMAFYRFAANYGADQFRINLIVDDGQERTYYANFLEPPRLANIRGEARFVSAPLEVVPSPEDEEFDAGLVAVVGEYGEDALDILDLLAELVNENLPEAIG